MSSQHRTILIVDDAAEDRAACRRYLRQDTEWRYDFVEADGGQRALARYRERPPDCLLLDYHLPDMDGLEVLAALTDGNGEVALPVVMLTGTDEVALAVEAMKAGAQDFINKNRLTPVDLQRAVRNAIERVALRREIREKELRFRVLTETMPQLVWTSTADGSCDYLNSRWVDFTGEPLASHLGAGWLTYVHPDDVENVWAAWGQAVTTGSAFESEFRLRRADGTYRWHLARALLVRDATGQITNWFGTTTDIEERKQAEHEREQLLLREQHLREQAEAASRLKDEFLAIISHELRTPLHSILGWAKLLRSGRLDGSETVRATEAVERNAHMQSQLIEDLLDVSRIVSGKLRLEIQPVDMPAVISAALDVVRPAAEGKEITLVSALEPLDSFVFGDATRLQQAVWNLLSNAVKFTPRGGQVSVRLAQHGAELEISVSDTGQGIHAEFLPHVFDRFRQEDSTCTRKHGGLGLGLSLVKYLVEMHGGAVHADSAGPGQGATFTLRLPLTKPRPVEQRSVFSPVSLAVPVEHAPPLQLGGVNVLMVDDERDARDMVAALLTTAGATVTTAASVADALEKLWAGKYSVLISDIAMPDEDGYLFIRQARAMGIHTPAIALTAYSLEEDRRKALAAGYQAYLTKPVEPPYLIAVLAALASPMWESVGSAG
jgi:PAS domain S-box-containing protein